jgi:hypothetical protein
MVIVFVCIRNLFPRKISRLHAWQTLISFSLRGSLPPAIINSF